MNKQVNMFGQEMAINEDELKYSSRIEAPVYQPKNKKPNILELLDDAKTKRLIRDIEALSHELSAEEVIFLKEAARRHTVFHYENIADYYAHASKEMQLLMEKSGLVIIDFDSAIQNGFIKLSNSLRKQYLEYYGE